MDNSQLVRRCNGLKKYITVRHSQLCGSQLTNPSSPFDLLIRDGRKRCSIDKLKVISLILCHIPASFISFLQLRGYLRQEHVEVTAIQRSLRSVLSSRVFHSSAPIRLNNSRRAEYWRCCPRYAQARDSRSLLRSLRRLGTNVTYDSTVK
ncbi:hypothetical protein BDN71DRAFT_1092319 [Pleurotus eryngii]|uniref:Uncharacterized protein n=1 Tax=Pleurotus eryngii TaxID=5323 RepID=A0A9P5ZXH6_PLEER|nr:hypothetical protein BDN71DRAFT_1092319 [Pleurotus eryngii]